jgi:RNA polymerase sigma-70 factor (ECF subfamily)
VKSSDPNPYSLVEERRPAAVEVPMSPSQPTDQELMAAFYACDANALAVIWERWYSRVYWYLRRQGCTHDVAEQLTQDVFARIVQTKASNSGRFDPVRSFAPWLFQIARNILTDYRRRPRTESGLLPNDVPEGPSPLPAAGLALEHDLDDCLGRLTEQEREFLLLWQGAYGELSQTEIAELWGIANSRVTHIKQSAVDKLRDCMEEKGYS